jgi:hypothetical protein
LGNLLLLPIEPDANQSLGGVLLEQPSATHAKLSRFENGMSGMPWLSCSCLRKRFPPVQLTSKPE